jgi:hypothetical protein
MLIVFTSFLLFFAFLIGYAEKQNKSVNADRFGKKENKLY